MLVFGQIRPLMFSLPKMGHGKLGPKDLDTRARFIGEFIQPIFIFWALFVTLPPYKRVTRSHMY